MIAMKGGIEKEILNTDKEAEKTTKTLGREGA